MSEKGTTRLMTVDLEVIVSAHRTRAIAAEPADGEAMQPLTDLPRSVFIPKIPTNSSPGVVVAPQEAQIIPPAP